MIDVIFGGLSYWLFGYGLSFGTDKGSNEFSGLGSFLTDADHEQMGHVFSQFFFQLSFATTATTIVSGLSDFPLSFNDDFRKCILAYLNARRLIYF